MGWKVSSADGVVTGKVIHGEFANERMVQRAPHVHLSLSTILPNTLYWPNDASCNITLSMEPHNGPLHLWQGSKRDMDGAVAKQARAARLMR